jgi:hypothetical protein
MAEETTSVSCLGQYEFSPIFVYCAPAAKRHSAGVEQLTPRRDATSVTKPLLSRADIEDRANFTPVAALIRSVNEFVAENG